MTEVPHDGIFNLTKPVTMTFPNLFKARPFKRNGKEIGDPKFDSSFLFDADSDDLKNMKALCVKVARANRPSADLKTLAFPFKSGDKMADAAKAKNKDNEVSRGKVVLSARSKYQPKLAVFENGKIVDLEDETAIARFKGRFYPGALVYAQLNFVWYDEVGQGPAGVNAYLNMVLSTGKGTRLGSGRSAADVFSGYVGNISDVDPTAGQTIDDDIPF